MRQAEYTAPVREAVADMVERETVTTTSPEPVGEETASSSSVFVATHLPTPEPVRALYMTSWVAGTPRLRERVIKLIEETEANAIVIDIKDDTGKISFAVDDPFLAPAVERRIPDIRELIARLHEKNIYVIGRISAFQDPHLTATRPEWAVRRASDGEVWTDRKGLSWIDAGTTEAWDYLVALGRAAYEVGFDELNYDYIRFPSDGNMRDIRYPVSEGKSKPLVCERLIQERIVSTRG